MAERSYAGLDEALVPLHRHLQMLLPHIAELAEARDAAMRLERIELSMPIEMDVLPETGGAVSLGTSPPLYYVDTGFGTAPHQLRITIVAEDELLPGEE